MSFEQQELTQGTVFEEKTSPLKPCETIKKDVFQQLPCFPGSIWLFGGLLYKKQSKQGQGREFLPLGLSYLFTDTGRENTPLQFPW